MSDHTLGAIGFGLFLCVMIVLVFFPLYFEITELDGRIKCNKNKGRYNASDYKCCPNGKNIYDGKCQ